MEDYIQFSAKTKSEAITKACIELGVSSDQLDIQVITEGSNGFFGIGSKPAIIKVRKVEPVSEEQEMKEIVETVKLDSFKEEVPVKEEKKPEPVKQEKKETKSVSEKPRQPKPAKEKAAKEKQPREPKKDYKESKQTREKAAKPVKPAKPVEIKEVENRAKEFLRDVFASMNLGEVEITSEYNTTDGSLEVDFEGEDMGILIGKRGQTLDSLQYLTSLVVNKGKSNYIRVKLDTEDYRKRRKETLENLARGIAYKVKKTRKPVILEPMNPYERRIIHSALQGNKFVETVSEGEEPYRHVVVKLKRN